MNEIVGRVWLFGANVDTDIIYPGPYLDAPLEEAAPHVLAAIRPEFPSQVEPGDLIVAGGNFGCGSSREQAATVLRHLGIRLVMAESFGRIFFRNAIAIGLPVLVCPGLTEKFVDGQIARVRLDRAEVINESTGQRLQGEVMSEMMLDILSRGGILELLKKDRA